MLRVANVTTNWGTGVVWSASVGWYTAEGWGDTVGVIATSDGYRAVDHGEEEVRAVVRIIVESGNRCGDKESKAVHKTFRNPSQSQGSDITNILISIPSPQTLHCYLLSVDFETPANSPRNVMEDLLLRYSVIVHK